MVLVSCAKSLCWRRAVGTRSNSLLLAVMKGAEWGTSTYVLASYL